MWFCQSVRVKQKLKAADTHHHQMHFFSIRLCVTLYCSECQGWHYSRHNIEGLNVQALKAFLRTARNPKYLCLSVTQFSLFELPHNRKKSSLNSQLRTFLIFLSCLTIHLPCNCTRHGCPEKKRHIDMMAKIQYWTWNPPRIQLAGNFFLLFLALNLSPVGKSSEKKCLKSRHFVTITSPNHRGLPWNLLKAITETQERESVL